MSWSAKAIFDLGRVSNLPTIWTNCLAAALLAGASPVSFHFVLMLLAMTFAYTGGMFLNDACDAGIDAVERPERPIPSGQVSKQSVLFAGVMLLVAAIILTSAVAIKSVGLEYASDAIIASIVLAASIALYNVWHKNNPISPIIMGVCRVLVFVTTAAALVENPSSSVTQAGFFLLCYLVGLTYTAKHENFGRIEKAWPLLFMAAPIGFGFYLALSQPAVWAPLVLLVIWLGVSLYLLYRRNNGDIPRAVANMIAGIALVDAIFIASTGNMLWLGVAFGCFVLTLLLQRWIAAT